MRIVGLIIMFLTFGPIAVKPYYYESHRKESKFINWVSNFGNNYRFVI